MFDPNINSKERLEQFFIDFYNSLTYAQQMDICQFIRTRPKECPDYEHWSPEYMENVQTWNAALEAFLDSLGSREARCYAYHIIKTARVEDQIVIEEEE